MKMLSKILVFVVIPWTIQEIVQLVSCSQESEPIDLDTISAGCSTKFNFKTIHEFQDFVGHFVRLESRSESPLSEPLEACLIHRPALIELKELIDNYDRKRPCKYSEVAKLDDYARRHFMVKKQRPWSLKFFTLFGVTIGLRCKLNLLAHLKQADSEVDQLDFIYSMASPIGWNVLINEHTKKTMNFGTSSNAGNSVVNRVAKLVPGLTLIEQLDFMSFDHMMNKRPAEEQGIERDTHELASNWPRETAQQVLGFVEKISESCQNLDQFYCNSILSLAKLNELGLLVGLKVLDDMHESSLMLHRWLAAASFCQVMMRVRARLEPSHDHMGKPKLVLEVIHDDSLLESRRILYSYAAEFDEITDEARANVWLASVLDGKWMRKDEAMFRDSVRSVAMTKVQQFIKGLERDYTTWSERNQ